ncbi:branched-chain amino acid transport protein AzlC [Vitreoscilla sp. C1]|uniref:AzlC family ABC transporter permease n=1 Tax=Vitreoscilla sp. (strain C1) TaxID=96942 RepID=UPI000CDBF164|nr:AzlC family ABC transporter permease [Vitreoscilla sp. C1]AUZ05993.1 branched-chain amino acid transport protein AzlC [Vitreoscilla sp. C1]
MVQTSSWKEAFRLSMPVAMGYIPAGMAFGVLSSAAGLPWWWSVLLSVCLYAGAAQYAAIPMLAAGAPTVSLSVNTLVINLRHIFYALPLLEALPKNSLRRWYALFALTDESFSVLTTILPEQAKRLFVKIVLLNQSYWILGTVVGIGLGAGLNQLIPHLDFALPCLFVVLAYEQYQAKKVWWPCVIAAAAFVFVSLLTVNYLLLLAVAGCAACILLWEASGRLKTSDKGGVA